MTHHFADKRWRLRAALMILRFLTTQYTAIKVQVYPHRLRYSPHFMSPKWHGVLKGSLGNLRSRRLGETGGCIVELRRHNINAGESVYGETVFSSKVQLAAWSQFTRYGKGSQSSYLRASWLPLVCDRLMAARQSTAWAASLDPVIPCGSLMTSCNIRPAQCRVVFRCPQQ